MRLDAIQKTKAALSSTIQEFPPQDISSQIVSDFVLVAQEPLRRRLVRTVATPVLRLQQRAIRRKIGFRIPFRYDLLSFGERFANDASFAALLELMGDQRPQSVLIPGCYLAAGDVQFWLRQGTKRLEGIDVYSLQTRWNQILPQLRNEFGAEIHFQQATIEALPFEDATFDFVATDAVLEHVRNLTAMVEETARVLKTGGLAWHGFGPLYHCYSGDHCMSAYGDESSYDHLLLSEDEYQERINDQPFFDTQSDPNLPFWARQQQFSFAKATEYLDLFRTAFEIVHVVVKIGDEALQFRDTYPQKWKQMRDAGLEESDLLVKSIAIVLRKKG